MHLRLLPLLLLLLLAACSPARREIGRNQDLIRKIQFEGNSGAFSGQNDLQLRHQLETEKSAFGVILWPLMYVVDPKVLKDDALVRDAYRLEVWYAHHGWFDARVEGWELQRVRAQGRKRGGVVDITGIVRPGAQSTVTSLQVTGLDKPRHETLKRTARDESSVRVGDPFDLSYADAQRALILDLLYGTGFPYASVDLIVDADPEAREVALEIAADPGEHARFGPTEIVGFDKVREQQIRDRLTFEKGKEYQIDRLRETQAKLFEMGTFSSVRVEPDLSDPTNKDVPIRVAVAESKWRTLRVGVGSGLITDGLAWSPRVSAQFRHANLFRHLIRWELRTAVGVYYEPAMLQDGQTQADNEFGACMDELFRPKAPGSRVLDCPHTLEPTWLVGTNASWPRILGDRWGLEADVEAQRDVFLGAFPFFGLKTSLAAVYQPGRVVQFRIGPAWELSSYTFDGTAQLTALQGVYGAAFENPYVIVALDERLVIDRRNVIRRTKVVTGLTLASIGLRQTLPTTPTAQRYLSTDIDTRYMVPIPVGKGGYRLESAFALRGEVLLPYTKRPVGYPERAFLGGANSVRGFRTGQFGPYDALWNIGGGVTYLPRGGTAALQTSAEIRYPWISGITFATFVDAGALADSVPELGPDDVRFSVGAGVRYDTLVGPIRLDVSARQLYPEDKGRPETLNFAGRGSPDPRRYDLFSSISPNATHPPFALVVFLAIGEAI